MPTMGSERRDTEKNVLWNEKFRLEVNNFKKEGRERERKGRGRWTGEGGRHRERERERDEQSV
jgi:hypothetical protein